MSLQAKVIWRGREKPVSSQKVLPGGRLGNDKGRQNGNGGSHGSGNDQKESDTISGRGKPGNFAADIGLYAAGQFRKKGCVH
jgi:hypothetical protein